MSWVTTVIPSVDVSEDGSLVQEFSEWLRNEAPRREPAAAVGVGFLEYLSRSEQGWGGWKYPEATLFGAALNHADVPALIRQFELVPWR